MNASRPRTLHWPTAIGLGLLALVRPATRIVEHQLALDAGPALPIALTLLVTATWVAVVGFGAAPGPFLTLIAAALVYAVASTVLSAVLSPLLTGELQGPLAMPIALVPMLLVNVAWGAVAGAIALGVRRLRGARVGAPR